MRSGPTSSQAGHLVGERALLQRLERGQLGIVEGDHELAGVLDGDPVGLAVGLELGLALRHRRALSEPGS